MKEDNIKELIHKINEVGYIYTPLNLCDQMINSLPNLEGDILVIRNIEFVYMLYTKNIDMSRVYYSTDCEIKKKIAIHLGIKENYITNLTYNIDTEMKFDVVIQNPPYNPNSIWKKFVEKGISLLKDDGHMVAIHPSLWRESTKYKNIFNILKQGIKQLHIKDQTAFPDIGIQTDWYCYCKNYNNEQKIIYPNGNIQTVDIRNQDIIYKIEQNSIISNIITKITTDKDNGIIELKGFDPLYNCHIDNGQYKQCGIKGNGTGWTIGNFGLTDIPSKYQFDNKIIFSYAGKPRAQYFAKEQEVGILLGFLLLTDNNKIVNLINSKMIWKIMINIAYKNMNHLPLNFLKKLNLTNFNCDNEEEIYLHYNLTTEEIEWIEL